MLSPSAVVSIPRHGFSESTIEQRIESAAAMIMKWSTDSMDYAEITSMFCKNKQEALHFIERVNDLQKIMKFLASRSRASEKLVFAQSLMQIAMKRLQVEFYRILSVKRESLYAEFCSEPVRVMVADSVSEVERVSSAAIADLRIIAECMISSGYAKECVEIYRTVRKSIVDEAIYNLGIVKVSSRVMDLEVLDLRIKKWLKAVSIAVTTIFNVERVLCDHAFTGSESVREYCFSEICKDGAMLLFAFPEMIMKIKKPQIDQKNIFHKLDMFTALSENLPEIEWIFSFESTEAVRLQAFTSLNLLAESISSTLSDFESSIHKHSSSSLSTDNGIHRLAIQSMDYLTLLADHREILSTILSQSPPPSKPLLPDTCFNSSNSSDSDESPFQAVSTFMARMIFILLCKLDHKARRYDDVSASYLFLANNFRHVVSKVRNSKLLYLLGEDWIAPHETKVKLFIASYTRLAWGEVFSSVPENPTAAPPTAAVYENFESRFKEAYRRQRRKVVSDLRLREEIISSVAEGLVAVYRGFYNAHRIPVGDDACPRFTPEDVERYLSYLFFPAG